MYKAMSCTAVYVRRLYLESTLVVQQMVAYSGHIQLAFFTTTSLCQRLQTNLFLLFDMV